MVDLVLGPYEYVEYKYRLEAGASLLYAWTATAPLIHDLHAERSGGASGGKPAEESFDKHERQRANGSYTAGFAGIHGWYWENPGAASVTIRLTTAGFYSTALEIRSDQSRHPHALRSLDTLRARPTAGIPSADKK